uniref:Uncharacterized protein n=1 Tax=Scophthalmus maximus TaxID=52904 RepID=A0A8D3DUB2_SCOMX
MPVSVCALKVLNKSENTLSEHKHLLVGQWSLTQSRFLLSVCSPSAGTPHFPLSPTIFLTTRLRWRLRVLLLPRVLNPPWCVSKSREHLFPARPGEHTSLYVCCRTRQGDFFSPSTYLSAYLYINVFTSIVNFYGIPSQGLDGVLYEHYI